MTRVSIRATIIMAGLIAPGCGEDRARGDEAADGGNDVARVGEDAASAPAVPAAAGQQGRACALSVDCPEGLHCDLGECIQACHEGAPCEDGLSCSARGRCLAGGEVDADPAPTAVYTGTIEADTTFNRLTDLDSKLSIHLRTDSDAPVRYRVELDAPHLHADSVRGEFTGEADLEFDVDTQALAGGSAAGGVRIFTTLGDLLVEAPIRVGLTGKYQGTMVYDGGGLRLGTAQFVLDVFERWGEVVAQVDHDKSLLFPSLAREDGDAETALTGRGVFTLSDGLHFTLAQVFDEDLGGSRNHFGRRIGREVRFHLMPTSSGALEGTFEEKIHGIFEQPVTLSGSLHLEHGPLQAEVDPDALDAADMPTSETAEALGVSPYFPGWNAEQCLLSSAAAFAEYGNDSETVVDYARAVDQMYHGPVEAWLASPTQGSTDPIGDVSNRCELEMLRPPSADPVACALLPALACALAGLVNEDQTTTDAATVFSRLYAHVLDPALLVAQDHVVRGTKASFVQGPSAQAAELEAARQALAPAGTWALAPSLLEYLRRTARRSEAEEGGAPAHHEALALLSRLFYVGSTIDGETSRVEVTDRTVTAEERLHRAQAHGVLALFEAATIAGVLSEWGNDAPAGAGVEFTDLLTPIDQGFSAALEGALVFGVPDGFIPFIYDPRAGKPTNVEQVIDSVQSRLEQQSADEHAFVEAERTFEANAEELDREIEQVRLTTEEQIHAVCGSAFELDVPAPDWSSCGADGTGDVALFALNVDLAAERLVAAESRIRGIADRIEIETRRVEDVYDVRRGTIAFIDNAGEQFEQMIWAEGVINAVQKMLEISANTQVLNFGSPVGMGIAAAAFEMQRTEISVAREQLQNAQEIRIRGDDADVEALNGMAVVRGLMIDMAQLQVEMQQELIGQLQANVDLLNALDRVRRLHAERARVLDRMADGPLSDPTFRLLSNRMALQALHSRAEAQRGLYLAGRALEYHLNQPFGDALPGAVLNAYNADEISRLANCLDTIFNDSRLDLGAPQDYATEVSVRERLGITRAITDAVTGKTLTEGEQFRHLLLANQNLDGEGGVGVAFSSNLDVGNGLWPSNVCDDRITSVEAQLVGDYLGDDEALVELSLDSGGVLRRCDANAFVNWSTSGAAAIQAGVNTFGTAPSPNTSLHGLSVASSRWKIVIPGPGVAPSNADVDVEKLDDIVLRVRHQARPQTGGQTPVSLACLSNVGAAN